jgi:hypothetical protein
MNLLRCLTFCLALLMSAMSLANAENDFKLPKPSFTGKISVEAAMTKKKSVRHFANDPLTLEQVSQLLWAANGGLPVDAISGATIKTLPSAGGIYPLEIFLLTGDKSVKDCRPGFFITTP